VTGPFEELLNPEEGLENEIDNVPVGPHIGVVSLHGVGDGESDEDSGTLDPLVTIFDPDV
jgi:hypothetical protein